MTDCAVCRSSNAQTYPHLATCMSRQKEFRSTFGEQPHASMVASVHSCRREEVFNDSRSVNKTALLQER